MTILPTSDTELQIVKLLDELDGLRQAHAAAVQRQQSHLAACYVIQIKNRAERIEKLRTARSEPSMLVRMPRPTQP